jgi:hypothetical protein
LAHKKRSYRVIAKKIENEHTDIMYPQFKLKPKINNLIEDMIQSLIKKEADEFLGQRNIYGKYKITLFKKNLLSIIIQCYSYLPGDDRTFNLLKSLTINIRKSCIYNFDDLFYKESDYEYIINKIILENIKDNNIPIIEEFANINKNRSFYLTEDSLVIYYELNRNSPYAFSYCIPQFSIPIDSIKNIINPKGPIRGLLRK